MDTARLAQYRSRLLDLLAELEREDAAGAEGRRTVTLDQQSVGRLSRMDALQQQAMAKAQSARRAGRRRVLRAALARIDEGEFGYCDNCGEPIPEGRLDLEPATARCVNCASG